jgi:hypothetical protein
MHVVGVFRPAHIPNKIRYHVWSSAFSSKYYEANRKEEFKGKHHTLIAQFRKGGARKSQAEVVYSNISYLILALQPLFICFTAFSYLSSLRYLFMSEADILMTKSIPLIYFMVRF